MTAPLPQLGIQRGQRSLVARLVQEGGALGQNRVVLGTGRQHLRGLASIPEGVVLASQRPAQRQRQGLIARKGGQHAPGFVQFAGFAQQLRTQQRNPRLAGESCDDFTHDPVHQLRLIQPLCKPTEAQPRLQVRGQQPVIDALPHQFRHQRLLLAHGAEQRRQCRPPPVRLCHQHLQCTTRLALVAGAQCQTGRHHALPCTAFRGQRLPQVKSVTRQRILICQQGDPGCPLRKHRILCSRGRLQIMPCRGRQLPALQGKFARHACLQRVCPLHGHRLCGSCRRKTQQHGREQEQTLNQACRA